MRVGLGYLQHGKVETLARKPDTVGDFILTGGFNSHTDDRDEEERDKHYSGCRALCKFYRG